MSEVPQTDVSRPSALPTARLHNRGPPNVTEQNSAEYLDNIEEEWNKRVDVEIETLVDGMVDIVGLAAVRSTYFSSIPLPLTFLVKIGDKDKYRIAQEAFQAQSRAESMVRPMTKLLRGFHLAYLALGSRSELVAFHNSFLEASAPTLRRTTDFSEA